MEISSITWFNGLILGLSHERGIDAIGLFGEIAETTVPQPLAAKNIISAFSKLERIPIDTKPLDRQYESIMEEIQKKRGNQVRALIRSAFALRTVQMYFQVANNQE